MQPRLVLVAENLPTLDICVLICEERLDLYMPYAISSNGKDKLYQWELNVPRYTLLGVLGTFRLIEGTDRMSVDHGTIKLDIERLAFGKHSIIDFPYEIEGGNQGLIDSICWQYHHRMKKVRELMEQMVREDPVGEEEWGKGEGTKRNKQPESKMESC